MIALKNVSSQPFVVSLYCEYYCKKGGPCGGTRRQVGQQVRLPTGESGIKLVDKCSPPAMRIEPRQTADGLHPAVLEVPQVQQAIASRLLVVIPTAPAAQPTAHVVDELAPVDVPLADSDQDDGEQRSRSKGKSKKASTPQ